MKAKNLLVDPNDAPFWRVPSLFKDLSSQQLGSLEKLYREFLKSSRASSLVPSSTLTHADILHFADSLIVAEMLMKQSLPQTIYDLGCGNGFPSLFLAFLDPTRKVVIYEPNTHQFKYLEKAVAVLGLSNVTLENQKLDKIASESVHCGISRGFGSVTKSLLTLRQLFPKDGVYLHLKGDTWSRELAEIPSQLCSIWSSSLVGQYELPIRKQQMAILLTKRVI